MFFGDQQQGTRPFILVRLPANVYLVKFLIRSAAQAGVSEAELSAIRALVAENPAIGDPMPGTGGARKLRFAAKGDKINLNQEEKNTLRRVLQRLAEAYKSKSDE